MVVQAVEDHDKVASPEQYGSLSSWIRNGVRWMEPDAAMSRRKWKWYPIYNQTGVVADMAKVT